MSDSVTSESATMNANDGLMLIGLYEVEGDGDPGDLLTKVRLPAVPRYGDEVLKGDPADCFVVRGRAVYVDGKKEISIAVDRV